MLWLACVLPEHRRCAPRSGLRGLAPVTLINTFRSDAAPVDVVVPKPHETVKRRPRPVGHTLGKVMLPRIPVDVVRAPFEIVFIANHVLPEPRLPDSAFTTLPLRLGDLRFGEAGVEPQLTELSFDLLHPQRVAIVPGRQLHHQMPVIRQQDSRHQRKRMPLPHRLDGLPQKGPPVIDRQDGSASIRNDGEEERPTRNKPPPKVRHHNLPQAGPGEAPFRHRRLPVLDYNAHLCDPITPSCVITEQSTHKEEFEMEPATELRRVVFKKYKALDQFRIDIRRMNVLVGPNNSGKSTILSAFRVLAAGLSKARRRNPEMINTFGGTVRGYKLSSSELPIAAANVHTDLKDTNTSIEFEFQNKSSLVLEFPSDGGCTLHASNCNQVPTSTAMFKRAFPFVVDHVPTLGPLDEEERAVESATVRRGLNTHRAAGHFRNYWYHSPDDFELFATHLRDTWSCMEISKPFLDYGGDHAAVFMMCKEEGMSREVFWAGFGFQVWCQLLTHLVRTRDSNVVVVDEPEIYLHADLQRQLMHILRDTGPSVVLATHSSEIISEAEPNEVVIIDKRKAVGRRIRKAAQVQDALDILGSGHNLTLTRIARSRRICFVEGKDARVLRMFARKLQKLELANGDNVVFIPIDGLTGWTRLDAMKWAFEQSLGESIRFCAVLDSDYRPDEENAAISEELLEHLSFAHILARKEIENYLLIPNTLRRLISGISDDPETFQRVITVVSDEVQDATTAQYAARHADFSLKSGIDRATSIAEANRRFRSRWSDLDRRMEIVPGKKYLSAINREIQNEVNRTLTPSAILAAMHVDEIPRDMVSLIGALESFRTA
jgi:energy-coupling factor transporter ATP-binding protein EcfA2